MSKFNRGDLLKAAELEAIRQNADFISGLRSGGDVKVSQSEAGLSIATKGQKPKQSITLGSRELASVQGTQNTDLWTLGGSTTGCRWHDYTNLYYDDTTGKLMGYRRTITIDVTGRVVKVSAEGTAVEIVAFVECEAQP